MKGLSARESVLEAKNLVKIDDTQPIETKNTQERTRKETFAHIAQGGGKQEKEVKWPSRAEKYESDGRS